MPVAVNHDTCIGCGACASLCPKGFKMNENGKSDPVSQDDTDCAKKAAENCPVQAITVS